MRKIRHTARSGLSISGMLILIINEVDFIFNYKRKECLTHNIIVSEQRQVDIEHSLF